MNTKHHSINLTINRGITTKKIRVRVQNPVALNRNRGIAKIFIFLRIQIKLPFITKTGIKHK